MYCMVLSVILVAALQDKSRSFNICLQGDFPQLRWYICFFKLHHDTVSLGIRSVPLFCNTGTFTGLEIFYADNAPWQCTFEIFHIILFLGLCGMKQKAARGRGGPKRASARVWAGTRVQGQWRHNCKDKGWTFFNHTAKETPRTWIMTEFEFEFVQKCSSAKHQSFSSCSLISVSWWQ